MFQNFHFCGGYENGILRRRFFLSGGGKGREGKTANLQNGKVQNDDAEGGRVAPKRETTRALRARQKKGKIKKEKEKEVKEKTAAASRERGRRLASPAAGKPPAGWQGDRPR